VSRLWTSELRLNLRVNDCYAELRSPGLRGSVLASVNASGRGAAAIEAALAALRLADIDWIIADARLTVADEYVYYALLRGPRSAAAAQIEATRLLTEALNRKDLQVQVSPLPGRRGWLAAAIIRSDLHAWMSALDAGGLQLQHLHPALVEDLRELSGRIPEDEAVLALLREQGVSLVRLHEGVPAVIEWERFDIDNRNAMETRVQAFVRRTNSLPEFARLNRPVLPIYVRAESRTLARSVWQPDQPWTQPAPLQDSHATDLADDDTGALLGGTPGTLTYRLFQRLRPKRRHDASLDTLPDDGTDQATLPPARRLPELPPDPWLNTQPTPDWQPEARPVLAEHAAERREKASR
jgi:hypothetical protein